MATFTPQDVITEVRASIQDNKVQYRYDDPTILRAVNHCLKRIALSRPDLFALITTFTTAAGTIQTAPADSIRVIDVLYEANGNSVNEVNQETMDLAMSAWQAGTTGPATDWMRHPRNPNQFIVYPPQAGGETMTIEYSQAPRLYALAETIDIISDAYFPVVVDCVVWWLESFDNESVANQRAQMFQQSWTQLLGITQQNKPVTDSPSGGQPPQQVV